MSKLRNLKLSDIKKTYNVISAILRREWSIKPRVYTVPRVDRRGLHATWLTLFGFTIFRSTDRAEPDSLSITEKAVEHLLSEADEMYVENKYSELYELLAPHKDTDNVEVLWRLSRVLYSLSKQEPVKDKKKQLILEAFDVIERALQKTDSHFAVHKWYAILLDSRASYDGIKARVVQLENVKQHMMRAIELNPKDATTLHMLGFWCYNISAMPWYQRKIASTIFAAPPTSSFEEALYYFNRAEEVDPNFYSQNLLMLGKTYLLLEKEEKARFYLRLAWNYPARTDDDLQAKKEASELLKKLEK